MNFQASMFVKKSPYKISPTFKNVYCRKQSPGGVDKHELFKNFAKFTGKLLHRTLFFNKIASWTPAYFFTKKTPAQMVSCESYC